MPKPILILFALVLCWHNASAVAPSLQQVNSLRSIFEGIIAGANYQHQHNFCRTIKNLGKDAVSCDIYQTFNTAGQPHSELATRIDLDYVDEDEQPIAPPQETKSINNYDTKIWREKIYAGPRNPQKLMTTFVVKISLHWKLTISCWEDHKCYAEQFIKQLNRQSLTKITGER